MIASTDPTRPTDQDPHDGPPADPNDPPDAPWRHPNLPLDPDRPLWVFGYGSLMWNPEFPHTDRRMALLHSYHRRFCVYSHRYRGTPEKPGLVLGLDHGGSCHGVAFEVAPATSPRCWPICGGGRWSPASTGHACCRSTWPTAAG